MTSRPILFSGPMVRALLDGSKTQTRRVLKADFMHDPKGSLDAKWYFRGPRTACWDSYETLVELVAQHCPYGQPGDQLWVRESWSDNSVTHVPGINQRVYYRADYREGAYNTVLRWRPSIHMPRWASRITLEITGVRVERLHACNEVDAIAEGAPWAACGSPQDGSHKAGYAQLWESINGPSSWDTNPWVWVIEFKRVAP